MKRVEKLWGEYRRSVPPKVSSEDFIELMEALMDGEETAPAEKHTCNCNRCTFTAR